MKKNELLHEHSVCACVGTETGIAELGVYLSGRAYKCVGGVCACVYTRAHMRMHMRAFVYHIQGSRLSLQNCKPTTTTTKSLVVHSFSNSDGCFLGPDLSKAFK